MATAHRLMGAIYCNLSLFEAAEYALKKAVKLDQNDAVSYQLLANVLSERRQYSAADELLQEIKKRFPQSRTLLDIGLNFSRMGRFTEANNTYRELLNSEPNNIKAIYNLAQNQILLGNFESGWPGYEYRFEKDGIAEPVFQHTPRWQGQDLKGKSILVWREQGIGDEIQFSLCYPDIIAKADHCIILCNPRVYSLFKRSFPTATIVNFNDLESFLSNNNVDYHMGAGSLMLYFRSSKESFQPTDTSLRLCNNQLRHWRQKLSQLPHPISIGISWQGGKKIDSGNEKSMPFLLYSSLFDIDNINWIVLQHGNVRSEIQQAQQTKQVILHRFEEALPTGDIDPYAALIKSLDLVVSTDSAVANIAGAIGTPTLALLSQSPTWTWTLGETFSLWYPSTKQIRRNIADEDWSNVVEHTIKEINHFIAFSHLNPAPM